jgi:hypothetical protein
VIAAMQDGIVLVDADATIRTCRSAQPNTVGRAPTTEEGEGKAKGEDRVAERSEQRSRSSLTMFDGPDGDRIGCDESSARKCQTIARRARMTAPESDVFLQFTRSVSQS